jgi:predicted RNA-binding Zn ribbon-like protein
MLHGYADLVTWSQRTGLLEEGTAQALLQWAEREPACASAVLAQAVELREAIYRVFSRHARGEPALASDLALLNRSWAEACDHLRVVERDATFAWEWAGADDALDSPLWNITRAAAELLTSPELARVRECEGYPCGWLFLDTSRNHSRRWCSMETCGNRAKARRHYARTRHATRVNA